MIKQLKNIFFISTIFLASNACAAKDPAESSSSQDYSHVIDKVTATMQKWHLEPRKLNNSVSQELFVEYIESLDPEKIFFTASDIQQFKKFEFKLDDNLKQGRSEFAFDVFARFTQRVHERVKFTEEALKNDFDFSNEESFDTDRSNNNWSTKANLDKIWQKRLEHTLLNQYLASIKEEGKTIATLNKTQKRKLKDRVIEQHKRFVERLSEQTGEDTLSLYLNALTELSDPHSSYFSAKAHRAFMELMDNSFSGIGATLAEENGLTKVVSLVQGGPAKKQGKLKEDDLIIKVQSSKDSPFTSVKNMPLDEVVKLIRGKKGTTVSLKIQRPPSNKTQTIAITRDDVTILKLTKKTLPIKNNKKIGYIHVPSFTNDVTDKFKIALKELEEKSLSGLVIDLRGNGGGSLEEAIKLTGLFIKDGPILHVSTKERVSPIHDININAKPNTLPLIVLTDYQSASASEIFAAAIQDHQRGIVIGDKQTHGKGTVQRIVPFNIKGEAHSIKVTNGKFYRITGETTQRLGVTPDIIIPSFLESMHSTESELSKSYTNQKLNPKDLGAYTIDKRVSISPYIREIQSLSKKRISNDPKLQGLERDISEYIKFNEQEFISLQEDTRRQYLKEAEKWGNLAAENLYHYRGEIENDIYISEAKSVMQDLLRLQSRVSNYSSTVTP